MASLAARSNKPHLFSCRWVPGGLSPEAIALLWTGQRKEITPQRKRSTDIFEFWRMSKDEDGMKSYLLGRQNRNYKGPENNTLCYSSAKTTQPHISKLRQNYLFSIIIPFPSGEKKSIFKFPWNSLFMILK